MDLEYIHAGQTDLLDEVPIADEWNDWNIWLWEWTITKCMML